MSYANKGKTNKNNNKIQQRGQNQKVLQKTTIQFQRVKKMPFQENWETMGGFIEENIKIVQHQNVKLNSQIDIYDTFLKNQLFVSMEKEPEKLEEYQSQNETKKAEIEDAMQNINHDINILQQQVETLQEQKVKTTDELEQQKQLQSSIDSKLSQQKQKLTTNREKLNRYSQECEQHMANCENDKGNAQRYNNLFAEKKNNITKIDPYKRVNNTNQNDFAYGFNESNPVQIQQLDDSAKEDLRIKAEAKQRQEQALQKNKDMKNIKNVMQDIQDITQNFNQEIKNQGSNIDVIEGNMNDAIENVEKAKAQLKEANEKQGKDNKKYCGVSFGLFVLVLILLYSLVGDPFSGSTHGLKTYRETHPKPSAPPSQHNHTAIANTSANKASASKANTTNTTKSTEIKTNSTHSSSNSTSQHKLESYQDIQLVESNIQVEVSPRNYYNGYTIFEALISGFIVTFASIFIKVQEQSGKIETGKKDDDLFDRMV